MEKTFYSSVTERHAVIRKITLKEHLPRYWYNVWWFLERSFFVTMEMDKVSEHLFRVSFTSDRFHGLDPWEVKKILNYRQQSHIYPRYGYRCDVFPVPISNEENIKLRAHQ